MGQGLIGLRMKELTPVHCPGQTLSSRCAWGRGGGGSVLRPVCFSYLPEKKKIPPGQERLGCSVCGKASTVHESREYLTVSQRESVAVGLARTKERT
ncbi:uncharacterized [Tachysurus ichikawai]